jgi:hypothetical protein
MIYIFFARELSWKKPQGLNRTCIIKNENSKKIEAVKRASLNFFLRPYSAEEGYSGDLVVFRASEGICYGK